MTPLTGLREDVAQALVRAFMPHQLDRIAEFSDNDWEEIWDRTTELEAHPGDKQDPD